MTQLYLIVRLGGEQVAMAAADVESVVEIETLTPIPRSAPHVRVLSALRSRVLTVIDCLISLQLDEAEENPFRDAVVVTLDGHPYALLVEAVEDVVEAAGDVAPLQATLAGGWGRVAQGTVEAEGKLLLLLDIRALIAGPAAAEAA
jgi:purine-binding chemotaxis protein CheW